MSQEGFLYNIVSRLPNPWISSDVSSSTEVHSINHQKNKQVVHQSEVDQDNSTLNRISIMFKDLYKSYYGTGSESKDQNRDDMIATIKKAKQELIGLNQTLSNDLLSEIRSVGGTSKLNKVVVVKREIKSEHDLTAVLSSALNARKNVITDCQDLDGEDSEWDEN